MELTVALTVLGVLLLVGLIAHGVWSARKAALKRAEPLVPPEQAGAPESRLEPGLESGFSPGEGVDGGEPPLDEADDGVASPVGARRLRKRVSPKLDALIDAIAPIRLEGPVLAEVALTHMPPSRRAGTKPFMIEGLNTETGEWEPPALGQRYGEFQAGVQLANRTGALNEIEYSEFVQKVEGFADTIGAMADFPDMMDVVGRARELDNFAAQHDAQLAVQLRARAAAWSVGYIQQHGARHGFVAGVVPGRLILPATEEGAPPILTLSFDPQAALAEDPNQAAVRDVALAFDVPQTDPALEPFAAWKKSAEALAADMDADIVDDRGRPLNAEGFTSIGGELGQLYAALEKRDLAAGTAVARRLFS